MPRTTRADWTNLKCSTTTISYHAVNDQVCTSQIGITASANQERDVFARYLKEWGSESSCGTVTLHFSRRVIRSMPVFSSSNPIVTLLIGRLSSVTSCRVITIGRLVVKHCTSLNPTTECSILKVELASLKLCRKI